MLSSVAVTDVSPSVLYHIAVDAYVAAVSPAGSVGLCSIVTVPMPVPVVKSANNAKLKGVAFQLVNTGGSTPDALAVCVLGFIDMLYSLGVIELGSADIIVRRSPRT